MLLIVEIAAIVLRAALGLKLVIQPHLAAGQVGDGRLRRSGILPPRAPVLVLECLFRGGVLALGRVRGHTILVRQVAGVEKRVCGNLAAFVESADVLVELPDVGLRALIGALLLMALILVRR